MGYHWAWQAQQKVGKDSTTEDEQWIEGIEEGRKQLEAEQVVIVDHENWEAYLVFLDCATQWRVAVTLGPLLLLGIDYAALEAVMRMRRVKDKRDVFKRVQLLEQGAIFARSGRPLEQLIWPGAD